VFLYAFSDQQHNTSFYTYKSAAQNCRNQSSHPIFTKFARKSTSCLTPEYLSHFRLRSRSSSSYVHHHLLGQVVGIVENSNNQPSPHKIELFITHSPRQSENTSFLTSTCSSRAQQKHPSKCFPKQTSKSICQCTSILICHRVTLNLLSTQSSS